jgi:hypothetical protein
MTPDLDRLRETERWIAWVRLAAVPFAIVEVDLLSTDLPGRLRGLGLGDNRPTGGRRRRFLPT